MTDNEGRNTDVEIWRKVPGDYYSPSIHVTEQGDIGINVGGYVLTAPVERWFAAAEAENRVPLVPDDFVARIPPLKEYTIRMRITEVRKGKPRFVELEDEVKDALEFVGENET